MTLRAPADAPPCLVLMFKAPRRSKRRLARRIGGLAEHLALRLFECAVEDLSDWAGPVCFAPAEARDAAWLTASLGAQPLVVLQQEGNLGRRINHVNSALTRAGFTRQIFLGIDCPALGPGYLGAAAEALAVHELALGPATDGGAVLIGVSRPLPDFEALPWSTPALAEALIALVAAQGWRCAKLATLADVDTLEDVRAAAAALEADPRPARRALVRFVEEAHAALR